MNPQTSPNPSDPSDPSDPSTTSEAELAAQDLQPQEDVKGGIRQAHLSVRKQGRDD